MGEVFGRGSIQHILYGADCTKQLHIQQLQELQIQIPNLQEASYFSAIMINTQNPCDRYASSKRFCYYGTLLALSEYKFKSHKDKTADKTVAIWDPFFIVYCLPNRSELIQI